MSTADPTPTSTRTGLRALAALLWRRRVVVVLVVAVLAATVGIGLATAEREYTATARVAATPPQSLTPSPASYEDLLGTMARIAESGPLLEDVGRNTGSRVEDLREQVTGSVVAGTVIIQVAVTDTDPERAALLADEVAAAMPDHDPSNGAFVFHLTEPAEVPESPSSPDVPITVLAGLALALASAVVVAVLVDRTFRSVVDADEVAEVTGATVLGVLPRPEHPDGPPATRPVSPEFGALRALRVGIEFASAQDPTRLLVVASGTGAETHPGWVEVNLAAALTEVGHRVLLVDADRDGRTRHPLLERSGEPGLYDVMAGTVALPDAVHRDEELGFSVLGLGDAHLAPPSLLEMGFRDLLAQTEADYDVVLVHAGSVAESEDARIMAIDGALLLTVGAGSVHPRTLQRAVAHLRMVRTRILGVVLTESRPQSRAQSRAQSRPLARGASR